MRTEARHPHKRKSRPAMSPCPYCKREPSVERCEPWSSADGPQPWYVGCYQGGSAEHFIGANGDTKADALKNWEREVADHKTVR